MRNFFFFVGLVLTLSVSAQRFSSEVFHEGFLITTDKDTINGELKYDLDANILTIFDKGKTKSFSSQKVFYFEIYDKIVNNYRVFYSIPYQVSAGYRIPIFFELVYEGKVSLLAREKIVNQPVGNATAFVGGPMQQLVVDYSFFFMNSEGQLINFNGRKKELLEYMSDKESELKKFIKSNRLDTDEMSDLVRITAFYNSI